MNKSIFFAKIHNDVSGVAKCLDLSIRDVLELIYDEDGFNRKDLKRIKDVYDLTDSDICEILFTE